MIRIAITAEAFDAIASTLPLGSVGYENEVNERRERLIWLEPKVVDRLRALREPGEATATSSCDWRPTASRAAVTRPWADFAGQLRHTSKLKRPLA